MNEITNELKLNKSRKNSILRDVFVVALIHILTSVFQIKYNEIQLLEHIKLNCIIFLSTLDIGIMIKTLYKYILIANNGYSKVNYKIFRKKYIGCVVIVTLILQIFKYLIFMIYNITYNIRGLFITIIITTISTIFTLKSNKNKFID